MSTAVNGVDVVRKREHCLVVAVCILHGDLRASVAVHGGEMDRLFMQGSLTAACGQIFDEARKSALVAVGALDDIIGVAPVRKGYAQSRIEERGLAQVSFKGLEIIDRGLAEYLGIGLEAYSRAGRRRCAYLLKVIVGMTAVREALLIDMAVLRNFNFEPLGQGVDDGRADAVQTAGDLVAVAAELTAGVQDGQDDRHGGDAHLFVHAHRDTASVILDADNIAREYLNIDIRAEARESFVYGVVDYLIHKVVQAARTRRADVHTGALADRLKSLKNLNLARVVFLGDLGVHILVKLNVFVEHELVLILGVLFKDLVVLIVIQSFHPPSPKLLPLITDLPGWRTYSFSSFSFWACTSADFRASFSRSWTSRDTC